MNKKKLVTLCMVFSMIAILAIGGTIAYFTDTDSASNQFTTGNVAIDLTEAVVIPNENGDLVPDGDKRNDVGEDDGDSIYNYGNVYPGQYVTKDPTITNEGTESVYMAAIVTVTSAGNLHTYSMNPDGTPRYLLGVSEDFDNIDVAKMVQLERGGEEVKVISGGLADEDAVATDYHGFFAYEGDSYVVYQDPHKEDNTYVLYFFIKDTKYPGEEVTLFERINFDYSWNHDQMEEFKDLAITIDAYATQAYGFEDDDCLDAMLAAFPEAFSIFAPQN